MPLYLFDDYFRLLGTISDAEARAMRSGIQRENYKRAKAALEKLKNENKKLYYQLYVKYGDRKSGVLQEVNETSKKILDGYDKNESIVKEYNATDANMTKLLSTELPVTVDDNDAVHEGLEMRSNTLRMKMIEIMDIENETDSLEHEILKNHQKNVTEVRDAELRQEPTSDYKRMNDRLYYVYYGILIAFIVVIVTAEFSITRKLVYIALAVLFPWFAIYVETILYNWYRVVSATLHGVPYDTHLQ